MTLALTGLDGSNPLAFMAALGTLVSGDPSWKLGWEQRARWTPILEGPESMDALLERLWMEVQAWADAPVFALAYSDEKGKPKLDLKPSPHAFRAFWDDLPRGAMGRTMAASFGVPEVTDNNGAVKPSALHFTAGQQQFLKMVHELRAGLTQEDLFEAVVGPWRAESPLPSFGWDARERRDYALRATNPSNDKRTGTAGADWLALMGWPKLPVFNVKGRLATTGCSGTWKSGTFRWPLWSTPCSSDVVSSLVAQPIAPRESKRRARGIVAVYASGIQRTDQGGYGSFSPATPK